MMPKYPLGTYPMSHIMKLNRLSKLQATKARCEICGKRADQIHHKDGSRDNHSMYNLIILCGKCHAMIDGNCRGRKRKELNTIIDEQMVKRLLQKRFKYGKYYIPSQSKFVLLCGLRIKDIAKLTKLNEATIYSRVKEKDPVMMEVIRKIRNITKVS